LITKLFLLRKENSLEPSVFLDDLTENQNGYLLGKTWRNHVQELLQLRLLGFGSLSKYQELLDLLLEFNGQVHLFHCSVGDIDLLLELSHFPSAHF